MFYPQINAEQFQCRLLAPWTSRSWGFFFNPQIAQKGGLCFVVFGRSFNQRERRCTVQPGWPSATSEADLRAHLFCLMRSELLCPWQLLYKWFSWGFTYRYYTSTMMVNGGQRRFQKFSQTEIILISLFLARTSNQIQFLHIRDKHRDWI